MARPLSVPGAILQGGGPNRTFIAVRAPSADSGYRAADIYSGGRTILFGLHACDIHAEDLPARRADPAPDGARLGDARAEHGGQPGKELHQALEMLVRAYDPCVICAAR